MNKRTLSWIMVIALFVVAVNCGKKAEETTEQQPAGQPAAATPIDPATAGSISGKVAFVGAKPKAARINMNAEAACASLHTAPVFSEEVVVNDNGTLQNVFVYVKEGLGDRVFDVPKDPVVLDQHGCMYKPHVVGLQANQELHVLNSDPTTHNVHPIPKMNQEWNRSMSPKEEKLVRTFPREEIMIPVKCNVHPWMKSYIGVLKHPYFAVTGADGSFSIKNLPPGDYTVEAWHEKYGTQMLKVTVGAKESKTADFTFKSE